MSEATNVLIKAALEPALGDRSGCCEKWPKPCTYHEGRADAVDLAFTAFEETNLFSDRHRVVVAALVHRREEESHAAQIRRFLITRRPEDAPFFPNVWVAPGGGVDLGDFDGAEENVLEKALRRELAEELGAQFEFGRPTLVGTRGFVRGDGTGVVVLTFAAEWLSGEPNLTKEVADFEWVSTYEAESYDLIGSTLREMRLAHDMLRAALGERSE